MQISIITINYNDLDGLQKTMSSVLEQTYSKIEYIVIDGGSTDGSADYIASKKEALSYWVSEPDKGIYNAMNKGIDKATGKYLLFLNSGDWLFNANVLGRIACELNNDIDIIYGNLLKVYNKDKIVQDTGPKSNNLTLNTFYTGTINHPSSLIRKELFDKYGLYDENLKIVSDWKFFLIAIGINNAKVRYLNSNISYFDMSGLSNLNVTERNLERKKVLKELLPKSILEDYKTLNNTIKEYNRLNSNFMAFKNKKIIKFLMRIKSFYNRILAKKQ